MNIKINPALLSSKRKPIKMVTNNKTGESGIYCYICNKENYGDYNASKKYCAHCNIYHEYANYLSFV